LVAVSIFEQLLLTTAGLDEAWPLVERFATLVRVSGSADEAAAAAYISERLTAHGVPHHTYRPELYLSIPREAEVRYTPPGEGAVERALNAKAPSFALSTAKDGAGGGWLRGTAVHLPAGPAAGIGDLFAGSSDVLDADLLRGKIVVTTGLPMPARVRQLEVAGAAGAVFVSPGERIHEAICTPVWGTPDLTTLAQRPQLVVTAIAREDGEALEAAIKQAGPGGLDLAVRTRLDQGWYECPLVVAEIPGRRWPEEFVLLHGHLDSWHAGIGDNAVGNGAMLEIARLLWQQRESLERTVRIAWWPGHSTGRYAGSTWYADTFARDIRRNCIVHLNCDSPGCRWATSFDNLTVMDETAALARLAVADVADVPIGPAPPERAGDLSFSNLGVSTLFMLSSTMPEAERRSRGYYAVGGCGGNIGWHTEDDTLEIADRDHLLRDIKIYALAVWRAANSPVHPLDYVATARRLEALLAAYGRRLGDAYDLSQARQSAAALRRSLEAWYRDDVGAADREPRASKGAITAVNGKLRRIGRILVNLLYSQAGPHRQDPALPVPPLPELCAAADAVAGGIVEHGFIRTEVLRAQNRIVGAVDEILAIVGAPR